ncbi:class I SAM-dependent methyltransferase [Actinomadura sp. KC216]|uniref:class I SAM-dependent methyltransferase n=1 Tax=Actinomadura sp. KC216 TaxID=2530370 RepID=UPI00104542D5|nr:class I SAM-dependent methyltransferase [Actinomadura sp. KC216]TDB89909.1 class I SAM-dependent methyltransferase [Actinomadura sp. KC216]
MPTQPPEQARANEPHRHRQMAESFGADAERYDRARPRYPVELIERIVAAAPGPDVLDVGCGTGIAARQLRAAGAEVLGVEPDARMADLARRRGVESEVATFEDWDPAGREFDAVVAAQAWHWIDPDAGAAKAARVLRPGGLLSVFWNAQQLPPEVAEALAAVCRRVIPDSPIDFGALTRSAVDVYTPGLDKAAAGMRRAGAFGEPERWRFGWERPCTRDEWLDQLPTFGAFTRLPPDRLAEVRDGVAPALDRLGGGFTLGYTTLAITAARRG